MCIAHYAILSHVLHTLVTCTSTIDRLITISGDFLANLSVQIILSTLSFLENYLLISYVNVLDLNFFFSFNFIVRGLIVVNNTFSKWKEKILIEIVETIKHIY